MVKKRTTNTQIFNVLRDLAMHYGANPYPTENEGERPIIESDGDAARLVGPEMALLTQEQMRVLLLNTKNKVIHQCIIYQGSVNTMNIRNAEILRPAVIENAPSIIVVHNHPSGDPTPSFEDMQSTRHMLEAARLLDIEILDHLVIGRNGTHVSMKREGIGGFQK